MSTPNGHLPDRWQPPESASPQAQALHRNFVNALVSLQRDLVRCIFYLRVISQRKVYRALGFSSIYDYATQATGLGREQCKAFLRIGTRLQDLPGMQQALLDGSLTWRKADILVGQANGENEAALIEAARKFSEAELKHQAAARPDSAKPSGPAKTPAPGAPGPWPRPRPVLPGRKTDPPPLGAEDGVQHVLFRLCPEQYSRWATLQNSLRLCKEEALIQGLEALLAKRRPQGNGGGYLLILHQCATCNAASLKNKRGTFAAPRALLEAARCDGTMEDEGTARRRRVVSPRVRRQVLRRDAHQCSARGCRNTNNLEMHHRRPAGQGGPSTLDNLVTLCRACHRRLHEEEEELKAANRGP